MVPKSGIRFSDKIVLLKLCDAYGDFFCRRMPATVETAIKAIASHFSAVMIGPASMS